MREELFDDLVKFADKHNFDFVLPPVEEQDKEIEYFVISLIDKQIIVK